MRTWIKRSLWGVGALIATALLVVLAWVASNWRDAEPQPWPEALTPRAMAVADADNFFISLTAVPAVDVQAPSLSLPPCTGADCVAVWRTAAPQWAVQRQAHAALGAVCEAGTRSGVPASAEPLPDTFRIDEVLPRFHHLSQCSAWLLTLALEASSSNQPDTAVAKLTQSARLGTAVFNGSQSLIGHMIALSVWNRHLQALQVVATQHPGTVAALKALPLPTTAQMAAAQRRWVAYEASFNRSMVGMLSTGQSCRAEVGFSAWQCRATEAFLLPNYSEQLFRTHWQQVFTTMRDDAPLSAVEYLEERASAPSSGLFGSMWHWRGTVAHLLFEVALPGYQSYFARSANLVMSAQVTQLWLAAQSQSAESRPAWLAAQVKGTPLAVRLTIDNQGLWQLRALDDTASASGKAITRWPALPA